MAASRKTRLDLGEYDGAVLDMDGVITSTAGTHMAAWKRMFDEYLQKRARREGEKFAPFTDEDYYRFVDGKPRYDGLRSFLESRGISMPDGESDDPPGKETISGLGKLKNDYFLEHLKKHGAQSYPSTVSFINDVKSRGKPVAAISASRNAKSVLEAAGVIDLFQVVVDGEVAAQRELKGKPAPDIFLEAAKRIGVSPGKAIVVEDALAGVEAGKAGGFGLVIGINRTGENTELGSHGADIVVRDMSEIDTGSGR